MVGLSEQGMAKPPLGSDLAAGVEAISANETIRFTRYQEEILPLDGYRFWLKKSPTTSETTIDVRGSFHFSSDTIQEAEENYTLNRVVFTAEQEVNPFNVVAPDEMWIAHYGDIIFAFTARGQYYKQADLFHYVGNAVYPDMLTQIIDDPADLEPDRVIVSNSMPLWLALNSYVPLNPGVGLAPLPTGCKVYPGFLTPPDQPPPFIALDIPPVTDGIMADAAMGDTASQMQLVTETVKITLWGLRNDEALTFIQGVKQYSLAYATFGIMNVPVPRDERRTQSELDTLAQKKTVEFVISYYQSTAREVALKLIETVNVTYMPQGAT